MMKTAPCWVKIKFNRKPFPRTHTGAAVEMTGESMKRNHETFPRPWQSSSYDFCWDTKTNQMQDWGKSKKTANFRNKS